MKNPEVWTRDNDLTPQFRANKKGNWKLCLECGNSDFSLSLAEVKCTVSALILNSYHSYQVEKIIGENNQICWPKFSVKIWEGTSLKNFWNFSCCSLQQSAKRYKLMTCIGVPWWTLKEFQGSLNPGKRIWYGRVHGGVFWSISNLSEVFNWNEASIQDMVHQPATWIPFWLHYLGR